MNHETEAKPTHVPEPLYSCSNENCQIECSYPADDLYWYDLEQRWVCENCWSNLYGEPKRGVRLDRHLAGVEKTRLADQLACVEALRKMKQNYHKPGCICHCCDALAQLDERKEAR